MCFAEPIPVSSKMFQQNVTCFATRKTRRFSMNPCNSEKKLKHDDSGPIPCDKNYTKKQIVAKGPWPHDTTQTIIIQIEHKELKETENDLHSKHINLQKRNRTVCLIDCASHCSFPLPTTCAIESRSYLWAMGSIWDWGAYPWGSLESP